ncbi:MAG: hypothetical protein JW741_01140 [Sedimentisphaerales bacterium]|nr:hypothetical protein [Sedimentisphaerales bacterium]
MNDAQTICSRCVLPDSYPGITFDEEGVCSVCREHEARWAGWEEGLPAKRRILERICDDARRKNRPFDVLVPLSGGKDSTYVLYLAVKELKLRCLAFTLDNGYLADHVRGNIQRACRILGVEHMYYGLDPKLMDRLFALFMRKTGYFCSVCLRAIGMATELVAQMHDVPLVFGGSSARTELPLTPEMFQPGPVAYVRNVLDGEPIAAECGRFLYEGSAKRRLGYRLFWWGSQQRIRLCAWVNLPDYVEWDYDTVYRTIREELDWQAPPESLEHTDCAIHPVTTYLHNRRFPGLEVERLTLARLIQAGQTTREEALRKLSEPRGEECPDSVMNMFLGNLGMSREEFDACIDRGPRHLDFQPQPSAAYRAVRSVYRSLKRAAGVRRH